MNTFVDDFAVKPPKGQSHLVLMSDVSVAKQYNSEMFEDGGNMFCQFCNEAVSHAKKQTIDVHI